MSNVSSGWSIRSFLSSRGIHRGRHRRSGSVRQCFVASSDSDYFLTLPTRTSSAPGLAVSHGFRFLASARADSGTLLSPREYYMRIAKFLLLLLCIWSVLSTRSLGQTTSNPDISVIPRFRVESNDGSQLPGNRVFSRPQFSLEEFEIAVQAYLNPYSRGDIFITKPGLGSDSPFEIEEAYATFLRGLPLDLNVRVGKYLAEFGKLNSLHPHAWPFLSKPLSLSRFLGDEGINDLGISASVLIPTGDVIYTKLTLDVLRGSSLGVNSPGGTSLTKGAGLIDTISSGPYYANSGRLMMFLPVGENSDLEVGLSGLTGIHDPYAKLRFFYSNFDFKYKWKPDSYCGLVLQGEALLNSRTVNRGSDLKGNPVRYDVSSAGFYVYGDYQFQKIFSFGARYDWSQSPYSEDDKAQGFVLFFGFYPVEETTAFRLQFEHAIADRPAGSSLAVNTISLQFMFSMGPHKAHPF